MADAKWLLVTGGSRGIGAEIARQAASDGYHVAVNYRADAASARAVVDSITAAGGVAEPVCADVADATSVQSMFDWIDGKGRLVALVNSAGIDGQRCRVSELDSDALVRLFNINVLGTILCSREAVKRMSTRQDGNGGSIVNISSMAATIGGRAGNCDYAASKAAVDAFTVGLAKEIANEGIRVNAIRPGMTLSDMTKDQLLDPLLGDSISQSIAITRPASVAEIAEPVLYLLSEKASYISGACIDVSGGGFIVGDRLAD